MRALQAVALLALLPAVALVALHHAPEAVGANGAYVVLSGSMLPGIAPGDLLFTEPTAIAAVGDILTYRHADIIVTHRVIAVDERPDGVWYRTQGDNNPAPDPYATPATYVLGRYAWHLPLAGHVVHALEGKLGRFVLVIVPSLAVILTEGRRLIDRLEPPPPAKAGTPPPATAPTAPAGPAARPPAPGVAHFRIVRHAPRPREAGR